MKNPNWLERKFDFPYQRRRNYGGVVLATCFSWRQVKKVLGSLLCFMFVINALVSQRAACFFEVTFADSISTKVKIYSSSGESVELVSDSCRQCTYSFESECLEKFTVLTHYQNYNETNYVHCDSDTVGVDVVREGDELQYITEFTSPHTADFEARATAFLAASGSLSYDVKKNDSIYMDSLRRIIVPQLRSNAFTAFDSVVGINGYTLHDATILNYIYGSLFKGFDSTVDSFKELTQRVEEVSKDSCLNQELLLTKVSLAAQSVARSNLPLFEEVLAARTINTQAIKKALATNEFVLLNFWIKSCGPCRKFNREVSKNYDALKAKGIEIVNVNADYFTDDWLTAGGTDNIQGVNLYEGAFSPLLSYYNPDEVFPVKVLYNSLGQYVDISVKSIEDLLLIKQ